MLDNNFYMTITDKYLTFMASLSFLSNQHVKCKTDFAHLLFIIHHCIL